MSNLTPNQRAAVEASGPVVVVAGAGSGKTTVLVERYLRELSQVGDPNRILALSFTVEAAEQLRERVSGRLLEASPALQERVARTPGIGTIHSFCFSVLSDFGALVGLPPIREILSTPDFLWEWRQHFEAWLEAMDPADLREGLNYWDRREWDGLARAWCGQRWAWERGKNTIPPEEQPLWTWLETHLGRLHRSLLHDTRYQGRYNFSELETLTLHILETQPSARQRLQARYDAVLVDEFQDTSRLQWEILQHTLQPKRKLFVVGDPKQSIYGFRGADVDVFFEVHRTLQEEKGQEIELGENFRTGQALLERVNGVAKRLFAASPFPFLSLTAQLDIDSAFHLHPTDPKQEAEAIAEVARKLVEEGTAPADIAVLVRVSEPMGRIERALSRRKLPVWSVTGGDLQKQREVRLLSAFLRALDDPMDDHALMGFLAGWGWTGPELWAAHQSEGPLLEAVAQSPSLAWFLNLIEVGESDWRRALEAFFRAQGNTAPSEARFTWIDALSSAPSLADAVDRIDAWEAETLPLDVEGGSGVRLLTVHGAKGLEFPHVLLGDLNRQPPRNPPPLITDPAHPPGFTFRVAGERTMTSHFETLWERRKKREQEESLRVLYVALTRAKQSLHCFVPENPDKIRKGSWAAWLVDPLTQQ